MITLQHCQAQDAQDPLAPLRNQFSLPPGVIYLDGNSLGVLPRTTAARVASAVTQEWGTGLIGSWNSAGWIDLPARIGDKIARLIGAKAGEVVAADSTSVNLFKVISGVLSVSHSTFATKSIVLSEKDNFPTDLYIADSLCKQHGKTLALSSFDALEAAITDEVALVMLTHVNYRNGRMHDMARITRLAHAKGALVLWDLAHSAGAVPVDLHAADADFAVGCGYKYLNGGPGAPAFVWVHPRHVERFEQPLAGWLGHAAPFAFTPDYKPAPGINRYICGTAPILSMTALDCGVDTVLAAEPLGGMAALRAKSVALTALFIELVEARCAEFAPELSLTLASPRDSALRGSQVCFSHPTQAYAIVQALIARGVVGDFRAPDVLRFGFTPLYVSFADVWQAVDHLHAVLAAREHLQPQFQQRKAVT
jgi:kynureninase